MFLMTLTCSHFIMYSCLSVINVRLGYFQSANRHHKLWTAHNRTPAINGFQIEELNTQVNNVTIIVFIANPLFTLPNVWLYPVLPPKYCTVQHCYLMVRVRYCLLLRPVFFFFTFSFFIFFFFFNETCHTMLPHDVHLTKFNKIIDRPAKDI